jgi:hypothetical protein
MRRIPGEVVPASGQARAAALALQRLGFHVLHVGTSISVEATEPIWTSNFQVTFESRSKPQVAGVEGGEVIYQVPTSGEVRIPEELQGLVELVTFPQPPELF